ncbi:serine hydrolase [Congregibacter brevis]|uniref:Serine hydrolase n=1 Tax=Congregibacter brevis TaxID=3081201 RepID=A0ABZ0ICY8_9GAMM|nr:serine hydrolase [Congregibacter sp. IMCC45268]
MAWLLNSNYTQATGPELKTVEQIPSLMAVFKVDGLAVTAVSGENILVSQGFGVSAEGTAMTATSPCGLYSATKVLASLTYAKLAEDGLLDLNAPLSEYLRDAPRAWASIPFYRLLNHSSGIPTVVNTLAFEQLSTDPGAGNDDIYRIIRNAPLDFAPGQHSRYRQSGYAVGEMILEERQGVTFDKLINQYVTGPAAMTDTEHASRSNPTQPSLLMSAGGYQTTAADMGRLFLAINQGVVIDPSDWEDVLLDESHLLDNYSLGNVIEKRNDILTIGHSGGGARANIRYAPHERVGVMICTDDTQNNGLAFSLAQMLMYEIVTDEPPPRPLLLALAGFETMTGTEVIDAYRTAESQGSYYEMSDGENLLNSIGYEFLDRDQSSDAITVFTFSSERFPNSPNTFDSLGEALLSSGDTTAALAQYRRVLTLEPDNSHAGAMIEAIENILRTSKGPR